ncbi:MAG: Eco57I restriction-modification methylase domain-containing protein [Actinomycetota bacterium]|nr:Eco57I restriction-modification methylase domain-containing protein [Actinomycetota bacterium]
MSDIARQYRLGLAPVEYGGLFSENFLETRLPEWAEYRELDCRELLGSIHQLWEREGPALPQHNEAQLEEHFVQPILDLLGHAWTPQAGYSAATGRSVPDYALFLSDDARLAAAELPRNSLDRFHDAAALAEAKEFERPFNTRRGGRLNEDPHAQVLRYLKDTRVGWGILTNGRWWRLYSYETATQGPYYGVDLLALLGRGDPDEFRRFAAFFSRAAFEPDERGLCLLDRMFREAERSAVAVGDALERQVFDAVPLLATGLLGAEDRSDTTLEVAFEHSLVFLYRMLFCLHAESRELLPLENPHYEPQSLMHLRREVADHLDRGVAYSERQDRLYNLLRALFRIVDEGEPAFGVNAYNGGLFSPKEHPYFEGRAIPDPKMAPAIDLLSRIDGEFVDFRELSVRHLGTIYEKLLAYRLADEGGTVALEESPLKHRTGSYFTPERVVDAIVARTLEPVLLKTSAQISEGGLTGPAALERFLKLTVCDPAAGSGHFLVAAVEHIAVFIATDPSYGEHEGDELIELDEIRRLVAERCMYGVDINPMAVELSRLSLWLATVDRQQPLTFLENLRVGNSIVGTSVRDLLEGGESVFSSALARSAEDLLRRRAEIVAQPSTTTDEVREKEQIAEAAQVLRDPIEEFADETLDVALDDPEIGDPFHWEVEFPEVFLTAAGAPRDEAGFDAIVGNPPYIQIQSLGRATAEFCRRRYDSAGGSFDAYIVFLERGLELLSGGGRLGFIVPNKFTKLEMAAGLRALLAERGLVEEMLDFGDAQLFGATNYTAILILDSSGERTTLEYRRLSCAIDGDPIAQIEETEPSEFEFADLCEAPWMLVTPSEGRVLEAAQRDSEPLGEVAAGIFTGLQTNADDIYIVEDLGESRGLRRVRSKASDRVIELEPDLLHPLASGPDVERYSFTPLRHLLLFPYRRTDAGEMELVPWNRIEELAYTARYLREHEDALRGRERRRMDHDRWYAYVYPKSLGLHEYPKLGVAATVRRLEVAGDLKGAIYFHNVRVNGILAAESGPGLEALLVMLNSRLLDYLFRLHSVPFANQHFAANKQFIAPLPIKTPVDDGALLEDLGRSLHRLAAEMGQERQSFLDWLGDRVGADPRSLPGKTKFAAYDALAVGELLQLLGRSAGRLRLDPGSRAFRNQFVQEHSASVEKLGGLSSDLTRLEREADRLVYDTYGIVEADRRLIDAQYRDA